MREKLDRFAFVLKCVGKYADFCSNIISSIPTLDDVRKGTKWTNARGSDKSDVSRNEVSKVHSEHHSIKQD